MTEQDWNTVTFKKKSDSQTKLSPNIFIDPKIAHMRKIEQNLENDDKSMNLESGRTFGIQIQKGRSNKKITQAQLASQAKVSPDIIKKYELGTAVANKSEINRIKRVLGIN